MTCNLIYMYLSIESINLQLTDTNIESILEHDQCERDYLWPCAKNKRNKTVQHYGTQCG